MIEGGVASSNAWVDLEARLRPFIARRVAPSDVDDVVQEVLIRIQRGLSALRDDARFGPWVYQIARSAVADHGRARARQPLATADPTELPAPAPADDDDEGEPARQLASCMVGFVARLPSPYREAVTLIELEGKTVREAAEMVGISISGMKSRVQRGRARLREMLEACCEIALDARGRVTGFEPRPPTPGKGCCP
jgi:RNA polymerase sigma-70 factor (ECF subfamily)